MALIFSKLQDEVKRRATLNQAGTQFDTAVKNIINTSLFRLSRDSLWRQLRRKSFFTTVTSYTEGTGAVAVTEDSKAFTVTGATFLTDKIDIGRRIQFGTSSATFTIRTITGETTGTIDRVYPGTTATDTSYSILPQEEYNLPIQSDIRTFLWHEDYGYPLQIHYITDQEFYGTVGNNTDEGTPITYRMWGVDAVISQPKQAGVIQVSSSDSADTSVSITIFGMVSGYPDQEVITTNGSNGTTAVNGSKSFTNIDRVSKNSSTTGRITLTADSTNTTVAVIPTGDKTNSLQYSKIQLYSLPNRVFDINVQYYKTPYALVDDGDVHELGQDFDEAIILLSVSKLKAEQNMKEANNFFALYKDELRTLRRTNVDKIDWIPTLKRPGTGFGGGRFHPFVGYRQVGGLYGPGSRY